MKKALVLLTVVAVAACVASGAFAGVAGKKICVDPGHGGSDPGAVGYGLYEKTVNLAIGNKLRNKLVDDGATVVRTRSTDVYVSLSARCSIANNNGCDRFVSTHCNAFSATSANGTETFCYSGGSSNSYDLRNKVNPELVAHMSTYNRGVKTASFYVLVNTNMPAILGEVAFISNPSDNAKLASSSYRNEAARAYLHGIQKHYGESAHDPAADKICDNTGGCFTCSGNWATGSYGSPYGSNYRWRSTAAVSDPAKFQPSLSTSGTWKVYAWWTDGANRSTGAPYIVYRTGGSTTVYKNQQSNGGKWNYLGQWSMSTGKVWLSCWAASGYVVVADAVKWVKA